MALVLKKGELRQSKCVFHDIKELLLLSVSLTLFKLQI